MGSLSLITDQLLKPVPCFDDDRLGQTGPTALTYTTAPMAHDMVLAPAASFGIAVRSARSMRDRNSSCDRLREREAGDADVVVIRVVRDAKPELAAHA